MTTAHYFFDRPATPKKEPSTLRRLLVRCPATAKLIGTGETVEEPLWAGIASRTGKAACPHCGKEHAWAKKDVILAR